MAIGNNFPISDSWTSNCPIRTRPSTVSVDSMGDQPAVTPPGVYDTSSLGKSSIYDHRAITPVFDNKLTADYCNRTIGHAATKNLLANQCPITSPHVTSVHGTPPHLSPDPTRGSRPHVSLGPTCSRPPHVSLGPTCSRPPHAESTNNKSHVGGHSTSGPSKTESSHHK